MAVFFLFLQGNGVDKIGLRVAKQLEIRDCYAHIFTVTCLHLNTPDQAIAQQADCVLSRERA